MKIILENHPENSEITDAAGVSFFTRIFMVG